MESPYAKVLRDAAKRRKKIVQMHKSGKTKAWIARNQKISQQRVAQILKAECGNESPKN